MKNTGMVTLVEDICNNSADGINWDRLLYKRGQHMVCSSIRYTMMASSNGNIFRVSGPLCGEFTGPGEFPTQRPVTRSFDVFFDRRLNKRSSKQPRGWWLETLSCSLWHMYMNIMKSLFIHLEINIINRNDRCKYIISTNLRQLSIRLTEWSKWKLH